MSEDRDTNEAEALALIRSVQRKTLLAVAVSIIKQARADGVTSEEKLKEIQEKFFTQNYGKLSTRLKQKFLKHCHEDVMKKLCMALPLENTLRKRKNFSTTDGSNICKKIRKSSTNQEEAAVECLPESKSKNAFRCEASAIENINFVQSMVSLIELSENESPVSTNVLNSMLYDETADEVMSEVCCKAGAGSSGLNRYSSDSGIGTFSEGSERNFTSVCVKSVNSEVLQSAIQQSKSKPAVLKSLRFVIEYLEQTMKDHVESIFENWERSEFQYINRIVSKCCQVSSSCRELVLDFIYQVLDSIWLDKELDKNGEWEMKIFIINEFIADKDTCKKVIQFIVEKINFFINHYAEKRPDQPAMMDKVFFYVNLFSSVCDTLANSKTNSSTERSCSNDLLSENYASLFWQEKFSPEQESKEEEKFDISEADINSFERLSILTTARHPLLASLAREAISRSRHLVNPRLYESQSDLDCSFSL